MVFFFFWFNFIYLFFQLFILRFIDMFDYMSGSALSLSHCGVVFHCMSMPSFIHYSTDGQWVLAIMNKEVVNILAYIFLVDICIRFS